MSFKIGWNDLWSAGTILDYSSQHPQFPVEDTQVDVLAQAWQTRHGTGSGNGRFAISATTKYIDFDEGGAEKTATLTAGYYNGTTLAAHVQAQLRVAGTVLYTCTYAEGTGLFTITSPSGTFNIRWLTGTHTATSAAGVLGYSQVANDTGALTYVGDYARFNTFEEIQMDILSAVAVDMFYIGGHNLSASALIYFWGADDSAFTVNVVTETVTWSSINIFGLFSTPRTKRYWRLLIYDPANINGYIQIGVIKLYTSWTLSRSYNAEYGHTGESSSSLETSDDLSLFGQARPVLGVWSLPFSGMTDAEMAILLQMQTVLDVLNAFVVIRDDTVPATTGIYGYLAELTPPEPQWKDYVNFTLVIREAAQ